LWGPRFVTIEPFYQGEMRIYKEIELKTKIMLFMMVLLLSNSAFASDKGGLRGFEVGTQANISKLERVVQELVAPPLLPKHEQVVTGKPKIIQVRMVIEEKEIEVEPGAFIWAFTFNGSVPGPLIVAHVGDYIELTLVNPKTSKLPHNIDFHVSTGALGGGALTKVKPGQEVVLRWKAIKPGTFVYHCAPGGKMIPWHVYTA